MKKSFLALAVVGAFAGAAQAQSQVTIYGIADAYVQYTNNVGANNDGKFAVGSGGMQNSRVGFTGSEDLGNGLKALFKLENGYSIDDGSLGQSNNSAQNAPKIFGRQAYIGLGGDFGTVTLGHQYDFMGDLGGYSSVNVTGSGALALHGENEPILAGDRVTGDRVENSIKYQSNDMNGFTFGAIYGAGEGLDSLSNGQSFGLGANYSAGNLGLGFGYFQSKNDVGDQASRTFGLGASYQMGAVKLFGLWTQAKNHLFTLADADLPIGPLNPGFRNSKNNVFDIGLAYAVNNALTVGFGVQHGKYDFITSNGTTEQRADGKITQFNLGADYRFSKRTDVYAALMHIKSSDDAPTPGILSASGGNAANQNGGSSLEDNQTAVRVGIRHKF